VEITNSVLLLTTLQMKRANFCSPTIQLNDSWQDQWWDFIPCTNASRPALGSTHPPIQWVPGAHSPVVMQPVS